MADYRLEGFSSRSFEQLVQSLAAKVIGPKIVVFGDGADGGREAAYEGKMPYPQDKEAWEGYLVVQAKFRQKPRGAEDDGHWALEQLELELKKFADDTKGRRLPEYYIYVTNVVLSPKGDTGAKDKCYALFQKYRDQVPIKDFDVWDYDKLRVFLDNNSDVRRANTAFITTGDVLAAAMDWLTPSRPDFDRVITAFLQKELLGEQYARLEEAGHTTDRPTPLAKVFVDLHASDEPSAEPDEEDASLPPGFLAEILRTGEERLDPETLGASASRGSGTRQSQLKGKGRFVLIGGPGQGKTTMGQFLVQLYRAAILQSQSGHRLTPEVSDAISTLVSACEEEQIALPAARRFPIRVVLSQFAAEIAAATETGVDSLLSHIARQIRIKTDNSISCQDLLTWLGAYPWVMVLDGLDEVPASSNRESVLRKIQEFWVDATQCNADLLVIATTRPQGYNNELGDYYQRRFLTPLSKTRAMHYGERLAAMRYGADRSTRDLVIKRLEAACSESTTERLTRSPLQVTIMVTLLRQMGRPPRERWLLFNRYFDTMYQRETERDTAAADVLRDYRSDITRIHWLVGLHLQTVSEKAGGTDALMPEQVLRNIICGRLSDEGHKGTGLEKLVDTIVWAATERLVFITGMEAGKIGFEIRSLQEFMAAEALMDEADAVIQDRLRHIATYSHWRNVFLFAAGKCFAEKEHLRDTVQSICLDLNEGNCDPWLSEDERTLLKATMSGSQLALDLLEDGQARCKPYYCASLGRLAMKLMELPVGDTQARLAGIYEESLDEIYREEIDKYLTAMPAEKALGAWQVLISLGIRGIPWAQEMVRERWPANDEGALSVLNSVSELDYEFLADYLIPFYPKATPEMLMGFLWKQRNEQIAVGPPWFAAADHAVRHRSLGISGTISLHSSDHTPSMRFQFQRIAVGDMEKWVSIKDMPNPCEAVSHF